MRSRDIYTLDLFEQELQAASEQASMLAPLSAAVAAALAESPTRYAGWSNSATYLADYYIGASPEAVEAVRALFTNGLTISEERLAALFEVQQTAVEDSDADDYRCGIVDGRLILDYWARGDVNWSEIASAYMAQERIELGLAPVRLGILHAIGAGTVCGSRLQLDLRSLAPEIQSELHRLMQWMGGQRCRASSGYDFPYCPADWLDDLLQTGRLTRPDKLGEFPTPGRIAQIAIDAAEIEEGMYTLNPGCGTGALLVRAANQAGKESTIGVEVRQLLVTTLKSLGYQAEAGDFMSQAHWGPHRMLFDRIVMQPPIAKQADIAMLMHAWPMLAPGGRLVAIMAGSLSYRENQTARDLRQLIDKVGGSIRELPAMSFDEVGTSVNPVLVVMDKPSGR